MLISHAHAQAAGQPQGGLEGTVMMLLIFAVFFFLIIWPQMRRAKQHRKLLEALQKGDEVVTAGGQVGRVVKLGQDYVTVEIAENVQVLVQKPAVQTVLPKGTIKSLE